MIQKFKSLVLALTLGLGLVTPLAISTVAVATADTIASNICTGSNYTTNTSGSCTTTNTNSTLQTVATQVVEIFSIIVGIVSVIMIIYGGFRYITSGGDSGRVGNAKNTLIYAIIGLIIVALAQFLVHYVLSATSNSVGSSNL